MQKQENPILNNPYEEPQLYYSTDIYGALNYLDIKKGRRMFHDKNPSTPTKQSPQSAIFEVNDFKEEYGQQLVNLLRSEVGKWRGADYPHTTGATKKLLNFWFNNPDRSVDKRLFFAQREAIETAIWINEVAERSNYGNNIKDRLSAAWETISKKKEEQLPRIAFKMATGTGKTVVMAALILYHFCNRKEYKQDDRFADNFLVVAPGVTIKDRLGVLYVDVQTKNTNKKTDYYAVRDLVPRDFEPYLAEINNHLVITNYHALEPKNLQGNKRTPFDGKKLDGKKQEAKENFDLLIKRLLPNFKRKSKLLIFNDEAHHCYKPRMSDKKMAKTEDTEQDENVKAAVWFTGLAEIAQRFKVRNVYDLSATPYYLKGSGYTEYSLFPWVVSDFGLVEAIEAGLVKIPFLPESDNTQNIDEAFLRDIYRKVKEEDLNAFPRKGQSTQRAEANKEGKVLEEKPPLFHSKVKGALDQFYQHYEQYDEGMRVMAEKNTDLFSPPPVLIIVCNNTTVSKEVYKHIAGYEIKNEEGETISAVKGQLPIFSNYEENTLKPKKRPPTLLIDSYALENSDQIDDEFKQIFQAEIKEFKDEYKKTHGAAEKITDAQILREVVNTVGKSDKLGAHIRCVVSVSMLTEGWDANTVTHIMGLRAFGSQLLCEQVAGRALRRMNYNLQAYHRVTGEPISEKERKRFKPENIIEKFPPEYAHIIGIPFKLMLKKGKNPPPATPPVFQNIIALKEREEIHEITFPNVVSYRQEVINGELKYTPKDVPEYILDLSNYPLRTVSTNAISGKEEFMQVQQILNYRDQEIIYHLTNNLMKHHFSDAEDYPNFSLFGKLLPIVREWYDHKIVLRNESDPRYKRIIFYEDAKKVADQINLGINTHLNSEEHIRPVLSYYNKLGSTKYVNGKTVKKVFATKKSHVNFVVMDSGWEGIAAKTLEEIPEVLTYVKNQFLNFFIPYQKDNTDRRYLPDFIAKVKTRSGETINLIIEITGYNKDKTEKKWFVENKWLPAVNAVQEKQGLGKWAFIEIENDITNVRNELTEKIKSL